MTQHMPEPLFELDAPPAGAVARSAHRSVAAAVTAGKVDPGRDALGIAHLMTLAAAMDGPAARDPRALTLLSKELRAVADALGMSLAPKKESADPFGFLDLTTDDIPTG